MLQTYFYFRHVMYSKLNSLLCLNVAFNYLFFSIIFLMLCLFFKLSKFFYGLNILENVPIDLGADKTLLKIIMACLANVKMDVIKISPNAIVFFF